MNTKIQSRFVWLPVFLLITFIFLLTACSDDSQPNEVRDTPDAPDTEYPEPEVEVSAGYPAPDSPESGYPGPSETEDKPPEVIEPIPQFPGILAFHSTRSGPLQIYTMNGESGVIEQFVTMPSQAFEPSWDPDCQGMAFTGGPGGSEGVDVYTISGIGQETKPLADDSGLMEWAAAWSPTDDIIAYQNNQDSLINVCFKDSSGTDLGCLERGPWSNAMPAWSPDGSKLAFGSNRAGDWDLFVTEYPPTGSLTRLTDNPEIDFYPSFSLDGGSIVYASQRQGNFEIFTVNIDGTNEMEVTDEPSDDTTPTWVSDDTIAFSSFRTGEWELYLVNADGSDLQRLTYQEGTDQWPAWCQPG